VDGREQPFFLAMLLFAQWLALDWRDMLLLCLLVAAAFSF
jgi:hypothetical protein